MLIPGELPSAVADHLQPSGDGPSQRSVNQPGRSGTAGCANGSGSYSPPSEDFDPGTNAEAGPGASGASVSEPSGTHPAAASSLGAVATDGLIRPLTLAPSPQPVSPGLGSILALGGGANPLMGSAGPPVAIRRNGRLRGPG